MGSTLNSIVLLLCVLKRRNRSRAEHQLSEATGHASQLSTIADGVQKLPKQVVKEGDADVNDECCVCLVEYAIGETYACLPVTFPPGLLVLPSNWPL